MQVEGGWEEAKQVGSGAKESVAGGVRDTKERVAGGVRDTKERASRGIDAATEGAGAAAPEQVPDNLGR